MPKTLGDVIQLAKDFAQQHGFNYASANPGHDACHVVSGFPPTVEGEQLQSGWELAVMGVNPKGKLSDLEIEGFLVGCDFVATHPAIAQLLSETPRMNPGA